jgi:hypothetical protein
MKEIFEPNRVNYIVRTYLPTWNYQERIEELIRFCHETDTRHVMLFNDAQHMVWNQLTLDEARLEADNIARAKERLRSEGIRLGINSSYNMLMSRWDHRGRNDYDNWSTYADGSCEYRIPCLLDPKLEVYLDKFYAILAGVGPDYIHIDDDHRYMLSGQKGTWGCLCDLHLKKFSELTCKNWNRESLNIALQGDRGVRTKWIEFLGNRLVEIGKIISNAVHRVNPEIEVGMMVPCVHPLPAMGHTIKNVIEAFNPVNKPVIRPCIGPYSDNDRSQIFPGLFYLEFVGHIIGDHAYYTPEIETTPFTRMSKSMTVVRFHITQTLLNRMNNPAISLCGYVGDSPFLEPAYVDLLKNNRNYFEAVRRNAPERGTRKGIQFIWDFNAPKDNPNTINNICELYWPSFVLHEILGSCGFSITYDESPIRFIAGDTAYSLPATKVMELLKAGLVLDAYAARALAERGFADMIGCSPESGVSMFGAEECTDREYFGEYSGNYIPLKEVPLDGVFNLTPGTGSKEISAIVNHDRKKICAGVVLFENTVGGKIAVLPYKIDPVALSLRHLTCYHRQFMFRQIFQWMAPQALPVLVTSPSAMGVQCWENNRQITACITNLSYDIAEEITVRLHSDSVSADNASYIADNGDILPLGGQVEDISTPTETIWKIKITLPIFKPFLIIINK